MGGRRREPQPGDGCPRHTICPGVPCPKTVLVGRMTDGSYLLVAILETAHADSLVELINQTTTKARGYTL